MNIAKRISDRLAGRAALVVFIIVFTLVSHAHVYGLSGSNAFA